MFSYPLKFLRDLEAHPMKGKVLKESSILNASTLIPEELFSPLLQTPKKERKAFVNVKNKVCKIEKP